MSTGASVPVLMVFGAVVGLVKFGWDLEGDLGAVFGLAVSSGCLVVVFVGAASCLGFEAVAGCHRKNSCKRVLTISGHSIMTMWLPSSMTFKNPSKRIYKKVSKGGKSYWYVFAHQLIKIFKISVVNSETLFTESLITGGKRHNFMDKAQSLEHKIIVPLPCAGPLVLVQTCHTCREPAEQALWFQRGRPHHPPASTVHSSWTAERRKTHWRHCSLLVVSFLLFPDGQIQPLKKEKSIFIS